jgi:hypothetical protein
MDDLTHVFDEFQQQVAEISSHADEVHSLLFRAELKNGTTFNFSYNADRFGPKTTYQPLSIFSGVLDIAGALTTIAVLTLLILRGFTFPLLLSLSLATSTLIFSALYNFWHRGRKTAMILFHLKEIFRLLCFATLSIGVAALTGSGGRRLLWGTLLLLAALTILFRSARTTLSEQVSIVLCAVLPLLLLTSLWSIEGCLAVLLFSLSSLLPLFRRDEKTFSSTAVLFVAGFLLLVPILAPML